MTSGITAGINISYDEAFNTRVSADIKVCFGGASTTAAKKKKWENPTINALTASPKNRDVRVHDKHHNEVRCTMYGKRKWCPENNIGSATAKWGGGGAGFI